MTTRYSLMFGPFELIRLALKKFRCPRCNYPVDKKNSNCPNCGQPLSWRGIK